MSDPSFMNIEGDPQRFNQDDIPIQTTDVSFSVICLARNFFHPGWSLIYRVRDKRMRHQNLSNGPVWCSARYVRVRVTTKRVVLANQTKESNRAPPQL